MWLQLFYKGHNMSTSIKWAALFAITLACNSTISNATCPSGIYHYHENLIGSSETSPLATLALTPGTYSLWVDGGIGASVVLNYMIGTTIATPVQGGITQSCVPNPGTFTVPVGTIATGFSVERLDSGINCYTKLLLPDKGFCIDDKPAPAPVSTPVACAKDDILIDTGNTGACSTTQTAVFNLQSAAKVSIISVWYNTQIGGLNLPFSLQGPGTQLSGAFQAKGCDPYQSQWCEGQFTVNNTFQPGQYTVTTSIPAVCQNPQSGGNGAVKVKGCFTNARPADKCAKGTSPFQEGLCVKIKKP